MYSSVLKASLLTRGQATLCYPYALASLEGGEGDSTGSHLPGLPERWASVEGLLQLWLDKLHPCTDP